MAQLKSTNVTGNLSVTGNIIASKIMTNDGTEDQLLKANGGTQSLKAITDSISGNATAITTLKGEKTGGGLPDTSDASTITVANALKRANDAYTLAEEKTTMSAVEGKGYATKTEAQGYANAVLGDDKDTSSDKTVYGAFYAAAQAQETADGANTAIGTITKDATKLTTFKKIENKIDEIDLALAGVATDEELQDYATKDELAAAKSAILGKNTDTSDYNKTVKDAYEAASAAQTTANNALPKAGGTMTGAIKIVENKEGLNLRTHATYESGIIYGTTGDEALTIAMQNPVTAFQIVYGTKPSAFAAGTWQTVTPLFQTKDGKVIINRTITATADTTNLKLLDVNGTLGVSGQITSTVATGTAPFVVASTTKVANLNADLLDGNDSSYFATNEQFTTLQTEKLSLSGGTMTGPLSFEKTAAKDAALINETNSIDNIVIANIGTNVLTLKRVTPDTFISKLGIAKVYNYKGTLANLDALKQVASAEIGDVYNIESDNKNYACKKKVTAATGNSYTTYWEEIGTAVQLEGYATKAYVDTEINTLIGDATNPGNDTIRKAQATADNAATAFNTFKGTSTTTLANIDNALNTINNTTIPDLSGRIDGLSSTITNLGNTYATNKELSDAISEEVTARNTALAEKVSKSGDTMSGNLRLYNKALAFTTVENGGDNTIKARMEYNDTSKSIKFIFAT